MTQAEFKICFDHHFEQIRNYIAYRCLDADLATDIAQETFIKLWEKGLEYQGNKTKSLLYKIASELWISQYRKQQSAQKYKLSLDLKQSINDTEENLSYQELKAKYEEALSNLSEKKRVVFLLSRMENMTYQEIATHLGISKKAVEKRMNLALKDLRKILDYEK